MNTTMTSVEQRREELVRRMNAEYAADRIKLREAILEAVHSHFADSKEVPDLTTTVTDTGDVRFSSKQARWSFSLLFRHKRDRTGFRSTPTGKAEATAGYLGRGHTLHPIAFRKDGTAAVERYVEAMESDLRRHLLAIRRTDARVANEAVVQRVLGGNSPTGHVRVYATASAETPVQVRFDRNLTEEQAAKLVAFLKMEGLA